MALLVFKIGIVPVLKWLRSYPLNLRNVYAIFNFEYAAYSSVYAIEKSVRGTKKMIYATHQIVRGVFTEKHYSRVLHYGIARYA